MYSRCLVCRTPFPESGVLENLPRGDRVAYDIRRGRLWLVCRTCRRWSLVPLESRWEALDGLERAVASGAGGNPGAHFLSSTDHIALFQVGPVEVIRVGSAGLAEEAWWRYGNPSGAQGGARASASREGGALQGSSGGLRGKLEALGAGIRGALSLATAGRSRRGLQGSVVWRGRRSCVACGHVFEEIPYTDRRILIVRPEENEDESESPSLVRRCPRCRDAEEGGLHLKGLEADLTMARVATFQREAPALLHNVEAAVKLVEREGPASLVRLLTRHGRPIGDLPPVGLLALEIYAGEARERALLSMEAAALEARWRREEELAALIDGDLTPVPFLERLLEKIREED